MYKLIITSLSLITISLYSFDINYEINIQKKTTTSDIMVKKNIKFVINLKKEENAYIYNIIDNLNEHSEYKGITQEGNEMLENIQKVKKISTKQHSITYKYVNNKCNNTKDKYIKSLIDCIHYNIFNNKIKYNKIYEDNNKTKECLAKYKDKYGYVISSFFVVNDNIIYWAKSISINNNSKMQIKDVTEIVVHNLKNNPFEYKIKKNKIDNLLNE